MKYGWAVCTVLLGACINLSGLSFDLGPVDHVDVSASQATIHVGDSTYLSATGFNKAAFITHLSAHRTWRVSDTALATIRALAPNGENAVLLARRVGVVRVEAQIEAATGATTVTIIQ